MHSRLDAAARMLCTPKSTDHRVQGTRRITFAGRPWLSVSDTATAILFALPPGSETAVTQEILPDLLEREHYPTTVDILLDWCVYAVQCKRCQAGKPCRVPRGITKNVDSIRVHVGSINGTKINRARLRAALEAIEARGDVCACPTDFIDEDEHRTAVAVWPPDVSWLVLVAGVEHGECHSELTL